MPQDRTQQQRPGQMDKLAALAAITQSMNGGNQEELAAREQAMKMDAVMKILGLQQEGQTLQQGEAYRRAALQQQASHDSATLAQQAQFEQNRLQEAQDLRKQQETLAHQKLLTDIVTQGMQGGKDLSSYSELLKGLGPEYQAYFQQMQKEQLDAAKAALYPALDLAYQQHGNEVQKQLGTLLGGATTPLARRAVNEYDWAGHNSAMAGAAALPQDIPALPTFTTSGGTISVADPTVPVGPNPALQNNRPLTPEESWRAWQALQQKTSGLNY